MQVWLHVKRWQTELPLKSEDVATATAEAAVKLLFSACKGTFAEMSVFWMFAGFPGCLDESFSVL